jgi:transcriptional regulator with XRE-family HTH domain
MKQTFDAAVGTRLRHIRRLLGLTTRFVADMLGVDTKQITDLEEGNEEATAQLLYGLCRLYDVPSDWAIGLSDELVLDNATTPDGRLIDMHEKFKPVPSPEGIDKRVVDRNA